MLYRYTLAVRMYATNTTGYDACPKEHWMSWEHVDRGWGRCASAFAYLIENLHWREYLHLLDQTGVGQGTRHLDIACGGGLAIRLACERGAIATGLDASPRLTAIAAARAPQAT